MPEGNGVTRVLCRPATVLLTPVETIILRCEEWCQNLGGWLAFKRRDPYVNVGSLASWLARETDVHVQVGTDPKGMPRWVTFTRGASTPPNSLEVGWAIGG